MNIEKLKYFIDLVENGSFTKVAKLNFVSQTTISQQIASLEQHYEAKLIDRDQNPVVPTEAGLFLYQEAKHVYQRYQLMEERFKNFKEEIVKVKIDYTSVVDINVLAQFVNGLKQEENIIVDVKKVRLSQLAVNLESGITDFAISVDSEFVNHPEIATLELYSGHYAAMVSNTHPLYDYDQITKEQLYRYPIVMLEKEVIGQSYDMMIQKARSEGYTPKIIRHVADADEELFLIQTENFLGFFPENYPLDEKHPFLKLLPIEETVHDYKIVLAYLKGRKPFQIKKVIHHIQNRLDKKIQ